MSDSLNGFVVAREADVFEESECGVGGCSNLTRQFGVCVQCQKGLLDSGVMRP